MYQDFNGSVNVQNRFIRILMEKLTLHKLIYIFIYISVHVYHDLIVM